MLHTTNFSVKSMANTTERHRPPLKETNKEAHQLPFNPSAQTAERVKRVVIRQECEKPHVLHSNNMLKKAELPILDAALEQIDFTCGSSMTEFTDPDDTAVDNILNRVFVRRDLRCPQPVEIPYYSSGMFEQVCCYCASEHDLLAEALVDGYYPICTSCGATKPRLLRRKRMLVT